MFKTHSHNKFAFVLFMVFVAAGALSLFSRLSPASAPGIQKGPYLQNVTQTSISVCWETDTPAPGAVSFRPLAGGAEATVESPEKAQHHCAALKNLKPDTAYAYTVKAGVAKPETGAFRTAPAPGAPFRFVAYGDTRSHEDKHRAVANAILAEKPAFVLNTGDIVDRGGVPSEWAQFFRGAAALLRAVPYYPALGNHEMNHSDYFKYFDLPGVERYYSFDYAGACFITLDSNLPYRMEAKQKAWLKDRLKENTGRITFVFFHHPPYSSGRHGSDEQMRGLFGELFVKGRVDAVFNGHDHHYERAEPGGGVPYVVTGGGGAELREVGRSPWTRAAASVYNYIVVDVKDGRWTAQAKTPEGKVIDTFSGPGGGK